MSQLQSRVSLLWPPGHQPPARPGGHAPSWHQDLGLEDLVRALDYDGRQASHVRAVLAGLCPEPEVISYRQAILVDVHDSSALRRQLADLLPALRELNEIGRHGFSVEGNQLLQVIRRLRELELYVDAIQLLHQALSSASESLQSEGLLLLHQCLSAIRESPDFDRLTSELPQLRAALQRLSSITIGVNLDERARPVGATLLCVNDRPFTGKPSLISRLLGGEPEDAAGVGIASLHEVASHSPSPFLQPLFRDLDEVLRLVCRPVAQALSHYVHISVSPLADLASELAFYLGACRLMERLQSAGLPLCWPKILPAEERASHIKDLYHANLALRLLSQPPPPGQPDRPVPSDLHLGAEGRTCVLTGPNLGGKTTYVQAAGLAHVMAQAGLCVPGREARMSPVDAIYGHFPAVEQPDRAAGRLGEEAQRIASIFSEATPQSLILLNESLSSTSPGEALYLARDVLAALRLLGARAIYATHLHELAEHLQELNAVAPEEPPTLSLIAGIVPPEDRSRDGDLGRTYRITLGPPQGKSYAEEIARHYGISLPQLRQRLHERSVHRGNR